MITTLNRKSLKDLLQKFCKSFVFIRGISAVFLLLSNIALAKFLGQISYGDISYVLYLTKFFLIINFGSVSGYMFHRFNVSERVVCDRTYMKHYTAHLLLGVSGLLIASLFFGPLYFWAALFFAIVIPFNISEPIYRARKVFYIILLPDLVITTAMIIGTALTYVQNPDIAMTTLFTYSLAAAIILTAIILFSGLKKTPIEFIKESEFKLSSYLAVVRNGFPLYLGTLIYSCFLFTDRFFIEQFHHAADLGSYMLAVQLAMGVSFIVSSQNFVNAVSIGENHMTAEKSKVDVFKSHLKFSVPVGFGMYAIYLIALYFITQYVNYDYLYICAASLGFGFLMFFIAGSITPFAFFEKRQIPLTIALFVIFLCCVINNIIIVHLSLPFFFTAISSSILLTLYACFSLGYIYTKLIKAQDHRDD